jgi:3-hydroxyisobutyrate dehydrogenase-like beta-hydroxyacid dehydrogenase
MDGNAEWVGFVGLSHLGGTMARRLAGAGHALVVHGLDEEHVRSLTDQGAEAAGSRRSTPACPAARRRTSRRSCA